MKVLVVCDRFGVGGTERHLLQVLPRIDHTRFQVELFLLRSGGTLEEEIRAAGIRVVSPAQRGAGMLSTSLTFWRALRTIRPNVVHFFLPRPYLVAGSIACAMSQSRMVMSRRSLNDYRVRHPVVWRVEAHLHRRMSRLVGNSRAVVDQLREESRGKVRVELIYNGIDIPAAASMTRAEARRLTGTPDGAIVIVAVANLIPYKGHADLIDALAMLRNQDSPRLSLICVGRDEGMLDVLRRMAARFGVSGSIRWVGEQRDVWPWWRAADIGVLCSHEEGFANAILEGMAAGLPMVVTDVGGNAEAVIDEETGIVVPPRAPSRLAEAIGRLATSPELRRRLSRNAAMRVRDHFSLQQCVLAYERLYEEIST